MSREQLIGVLGAQPFVPFDIHVADGDVLHVKHRDFMWMSPVGERSLSPAGPTKTTAWR
jgi:hypothetical protein